jgi:hypothetical protein
MEDKGLPDGMIFQKQDGTLQAVKCVGGSAAQSALFPLLDCMLGVKHATPTDGAQSVFQVNGNLSPIQPSWGDPVTNSLLRK